MTYSALAKAFHDELVSQDPKDESVKVLLAIIAVISDVTLIKNRATPKTKKKIKTA